MPQSLSKVFVHITFSTKHRYPFIDENVKERLWGYLGGICRGLECNPIQIGGYDDHVHILCLLSKKITQIKLIEEVKKQSSKWIKTIDRSYSKFYWQDGYSIFSVNPSEINIIIDYIKNQKEHHRKRTYKNELISFLKKYQVSYNEQYLWE